MELRDAIRGRRMIRSYDPDRDVARETVDALLELAIRAPSAGHTQGWKFLVLDDITSRQRFWAATRAGFCTVDCMRLFLLLFTASGR